MKQRILVADDEGPIRRLLEEICEQAGFTVDAVSDGEAAYVLMSSLIRRYALAFIDIQMSGWNGVDALMMLEGKENGRRFVVVVSSCVNDEVRSFLDLHPNVVLILDKPFSVQDVLAVLHSVKVEVLIPHHEKE